jgi:ABC-type nitrate/sulfonate/bicarbonate transport system substrate-binding protein
MRHLSSFVALCAAVLSAACGRAAPAPETATVGARATTIRMEVGGTPDATDIARLIAVETLRAQGYAVETLNYADDALMFVGMQQGDVDVASVSDLVGWNAIAQGAPALALLDESRMTVLLAADASIRTCADLHGKPVGTGPVGGGNMLMTHRYVETTCPGTEPQYVRIAGGSPVKLAALAAGAVNATTLELYDWVELPPAYAGRFHVLAWYSDVFPGLTSISTFVRRDFADSYPETVRDLVRAILQARRRIQDPAVLAEELAKRLGLDPVRARKTAEAFLERQVWDVNGGYTMERLQSHIRFYVDAGALPPTIEAGDVADLSYLEAVLREIGRQ